MSEIHNVPIPEQRRTPSTDEAAAHNPYDLPAMLARAQKIARGMLPCDADADDAAQDSVVNYWLKCEKYGKPQSPDAYLGTIVRNQVTTLWRKEGRRFSQEVPLDASSNDESEGTFMDMLAARGRSIQGQVCDNESMAELGANWHMLTEQQQQFLTRWLDGQEPHEIGQELGVSANQVSACVSRARNKLRRLFELSLLPKDELDLVLENNKEAARLYRKRRALDNPQSED